MKRTISEDASQVAQDLRRAGRFPAVQQMPNPYAVLGLAVGEQDSGTMRRAFLRAVRSYPPASHPTEFVCVVEAYEMLRDPVRRAAIENGLAGMAAAAGKHRRIGGLTPQSAAAFLRARDGPVCALDQQGLCHPTGTMRHADAGAIDACNSHGEIDVGDADLHRREMGAFPHVHPGAVQRGTTRGSVAAPAQQEPKGGDVDVPIGEEEVLLRTNSVASAMNLEPLGRTASVSSAMSI